MSDDLNYLMNVVRNIEKKYPVETWEVNGILIWPIIRLSLIKKDNTKNVAKTEKKKVFPAILSNISNKFKLIKRLLTIFAKKTVDFKHNDNLKEEKDIVFLTFSMYRNTKLNNEYYDIHCQPLIEQVSEYKSLILELESDSCHYKIPRNGKSIMILEKILLISIKRFFCKLFKKREKIFREKMIYFNDVKKELEIKDITSPLLEPNNLYSCINDLEIYTEMWMNLLTIIKPKMVITVYYYHLLGMAFNLAAAKLNIVSADLQHGAYGYEHLAYNEWNTPSGGYKILPKYFLCWSKAEEAMINKWAYGDKWHEAVIIGYIWLKMWKENKNNKDINKEIDEANKFVVNKNIIRILYTMQTGFEIPNKMLNIIDNSPDNWEWWIRLHPSMLDKAFEIEKDIRRKIKNDNIVIEKATKLPLYSYIQSMNIHITDSSTVSIECAYFGIPSINFRDYSVKYYQNLIDGKAFENIPIEEMSVAKIENVLRNKQIEAISNNANNDISDFKAKFLK